MYSNNDWRCYQEYDNYLEHKFSIQGAKNKLKQFSKSVSDVGNKLRTSANNAVSNVKSKISDKSSSKKTEEKKETVSAAKPGKWEWPNGKNSKEYNHWYYENHTKIKNMEARIANGEIEEPTFNGKRWSEMSDFEKQMYMNKNGDSNISELFISQYWNRPLSLIFGIINPKSGMLGIYAESVGRDFIATNAYLKTAEQTIERKLSRGEIDPETGFKKKTKEMSRKEDLDQVNPGFKNWDTNSKNNCMLCTTTYDLRRRGYDVTANKSTEGFEVAALNDWYPDAEIKTVKSEPIATNYWGEIDADRYWQEQPARATKNAEKLINELEKQPDGARGNLMVYWAGFSGGHSMAYEIVNGQVMILDGQSNTIYDSRSEVMSLLKNCDGDFNYARLDNVDVDPEAIKRASKS